MTTCKRFTNSLPKLSLITSAPCHKVGDPLLATKRGYFRLPQGGQHPELANRSGTHLACHNVPPPTRRETSLRDTRLAKRGGGVSSPPSRHAVPRPKTPQRMQGIGRLPCHNGSEERVANPLGTFFQAPKCHNLTKEGEYPPFPQWQRRASSSPTGLRPKKPPPTLRVSALCGY